MLGATTDEAQFADRVTVGLGRHSTGQYRRRSMARSLALDGSAIDPARPAPAMAERLHGLSDQRSALIGRAREIDELERLLVRSRLVTLTGVGGVGKTRLALAVAARVAPRYPDGVWLVDVAPVVESGPEGTDPESVGRAIAAVIGVREERGRSLLATLSEALRARRSLLLVLDSCERLVAAASAVLDALLPSCPALRVLATSRQALGAGGETRLLIDPLPVPPEHAAAAEAASWPAAQLFVERVAARHPAFVLTDEVAPAVAAICRRLEGIPLALELSAARVGVLGVAQLAARLDDALHALGTADGGVPPRHRTLRAALDWSHGTLGLRERVLFRRLAVFAGGWTPEAAEAVCAGDGLSRAEILDLLSGLVDKSLVLAPDGRRGVVRHRFHEVVRQYAAERLRASGEDNRLRRAHAAHCLALARAAEPALWGAEQRRRLAELAAEHDDMRAALAWCRGSGDPGLAELGLRLAAALWWFWFVRGHLVEGRERLAAALVAGWAAPADARGPALYRAGHLAWAQGDHGQAVALCGEAEQLCRAAGDRFGAAVARGVRASTAYARGDVGAAIDLGGEVLAEMRAIGHAWGEAMTLVGHGIGVLRAGAAGPARELLEAGLARHRRLGDRRGEGEALNSLAIAAREVGELARAAALHEAALARFLALGDDWQGAGVLVDRADLAVREDDPGRAAELCREALVGYRRLGDRWGVAACLERIGWLEPAPARAALLLGAAESVRREMGAALPSLDAASHARAVSTAAASLGGAAFERAWAGGEALPVDEAIALALGERLEETGSAAVALTARQRQVAGLVAGGLSDRRIAQRLTISLSTAKRHVHDILERLGLRNRTELALWARERGLRVGGDEQGSSSTSLDE